MTPETRARHSEIKTSLGLSSSVSKSQETTAQKRKSLWPLFLALIILISLVFVIYYATRLISERESEFAAQKREREVAEELARRSAVQYAQVAFLDSFPPLVNISDESGPLYAKNSDGSFTPLRARSSTWINYIPVSESTELHYYFTAEGFKRLKKTIAYADWYPNRDPEITLQKTYRKVVLEPIKTPVLPYCEALKEHEHFKNACDFLVFDEIVWREGYNEKMSVLADSDENEKTAKSKTASQYTAEFPRQLTGSIEIRSDHADTKVFFMGEPLMIVRESGAMVQARVNPDEPFIFSTYGQERPISITQALSIRLEAPGQPPFVTEIQAHEWHCEPKDMESFLAIEPPPYVLDGSDALLLHYACDYNLVIDVQFKRFQ
ncbi:MAG: hypothetical protein WC966_11805 [Bradymonadales bacterium]|jgi:hypothetical protein